MQKFMDIYLDRKFLFPWNDAIPAILAVDEIHARNAGSILKGRTADSPISCIGIQADNAGHMVILVQFNLAV